MCGIAGIFQFHNAHLDPDVLRRMSQAFAHRGPDGCGFLAWSPTSSTPSSQSVTCAQSVSDLPSHQLSLMHRRLAILDLSPAGWQPMTSHDGRYHLVFNGEIYNFLELQTELKALGWPFKSYSDTEVLLNAYAQWGVAALPRLTGMFAFALLDIQERTLCLARDPFGIKPLFYTVDNNRFAFASEIETLLEIPGLSKQINSDVLYQYLHNGQTDHTTSSFFDAIEQVLPAHYLEIVLDEISLDRPPHLTPQPYWTVDLTQQLEISFSEATARLRQTFLASVDLHLRSDVPVGAALSGGIDSSAIVMAMRHLKGPELKLHTFSYIANDAALSEEVWIDQIGQAANVMAHKVQPQPHELARDLDALIKAQGEPFRSTSMYVQYRVFQLAKATGIKVMLDGQGADELLGGYRPYLGARLASLVAQGRYYQALKFIKGVSASLPDVNWRFLLTRAGGMLLPERLQNFSRWFVGQQRFLPWLNAAWINTNRLSPMPLRLNQQSDVLQEQLYRATTKVSVPQLLRYEDRNSMAHSIESRVPFLTTELAEFLLALPESYLIGPNGTSKRVFRAAMRGIVPDAVLDRQDKVGFATPEYRWLLNQKDWFWQVLNSERAHQIPALNLKRVHQEFEAITQGRQKFDYRVWRWINLIRWAECFDVTF